MKAIWNNRVIAKSLDVIEIDGTYYFPLSSIKKQYFIKSKTKSSCPWKGKASYLHLKINDRMNEDAAWYYDESAECANVLRNRIGFWKGVEIKGNISTSPFSVLKNALGMLFF